MPEKPADFFRITIKSRDEIHALQEYGWIYRGQESSDWDLATSLERCCERHKVATGDRPKVERELCREFRRAYHHYALHIPEKDSVAEWLALMQHYGAPTRLLDFSYSVHVAAYFAVEKAATASAVWAIRFQ